MGHTTPNSLVFTDDANNDFRFRGGSVIAVNAEGWFTETIEIAGPYKFGQHNFQVVTPSLQVIQTSLPDPPARHARQAEERQLGPPGPRPKPIFHS